ncbi:hypothetical protein EPN83_00760 [Patescibacteria group bacterium]|nr:MAG: hypothetical protein EPN83_00760 [Patescibacteria group bacterium]
MKRHRQERLEEEYRALQCTIEQCLLENRDMRKDLNDPYRVGGAASLVDGIRDNIEVIRSLSVRRDKIARKLGITT